MNKLLEQQRIRKELEDKAIAILDEASKQIQELEKQVNEQSQLIEQLTVKLKLGVKFN